MNLEERSKARDIVEMEEDWQEIEVLPHDEEKKEEEKPAHNEELEGGAPLEEPQKEVVSQHLKLIFD
jgi:hypothetical protein